MERHSPRDPPAFLAFFLVLILAPGISAAASAPPAPAAAIQCIPGETPSPISLAGLWAEAREREPGYVAADWTVQAERETEAAVQREWIPTAALEGVGNHGQRLSPSEERALGVGPRGELRFLATWTLLDSGRGRRGEVARRLQDQARAASGEFDSTFRAALATLYVEAEATEALWEVRSAHAERLDELTGPVRERLEAGVDVVWEQHLLDEAVARAARLLADAAQLRAGARSELAVVAGRCVRTGAVAADATALSPDPTFENPRVTTLVEQSRTLAARAREERSRDRWQVQLLGSAGPNHSRALDPGPVRNEYLVGIGVSWRPDLKGVQGRLAAAQSARARALQAEAESVHLALERDAARAGTALEHGDSRRDELAAERDQAERRLEIALLRWQEGVGRWVDVVQAMERVLEVDTLAVQLEQEIALAAVRLGDLTGRVDEIPLLLGQEPQP